MYSRVPDDVNGFSGQKAILLDEAGFIIGGLGQGCLSGSCIGVRESMCSQKEQGSRRTLLERYTRTRSEATAGASVNRRRLCGCM